MSYIQDKIMDEMVKIHEDLIKQVFKMAYNRDMTIEDGRKMTMYKDTRRYSMDYDLAFEGVIIGRVTFINEGPKFTVKFTPRKEFT